MDLGEFMEGLRGRFAERVLPHIEGGNHGAAYMEMCDIVCIINLRKSEIATEVHSGLGYIAAANVLLEKLERGHASSDDVRWFRAYSAQTALPVR